MAWFKDLSTEQLSARLQEANWAYRNTDKVLLGDDAFDRGLEELKRRSPQHPFLKVIGCPGTGTVLLPYVMGSLNKVRAGEGGLERFIRRWPGAREFVVSEKLDGLSAMLVCGAKPKLYLQGDGVKGVDVSRAAKFIQGCWGPAQWCAPGEEGSGPIVRGEIVLSREQTPEGSIGRSLVNGWIHKSLDESRPVPDELRKCTFVAYSMYRPGDMSRKEQLEWLAATRFEVPVWTCWDRKETTDKKACEILQRWRDASKYPLDGIVFGTNTVPEELGGGEDKNPSDACAFKMALEEQKAETRVVGIEWNESRQGFLIPRIQIEPVQIGGATIEWLSGHNAKAVQAGGVGPGARIRIRRSGDVIPTLEEVLEVAGGGAALPDGLGVRWDWDDTATHAKLRVREDPGPALLHALQVFGVPGIGPGLVKQLVEAGLDSIVALRDCKREALAAAIGGGRGPALQEALRTALGKATGMDLLLASNKLPRGVGERKLRILFEIEPNHWKWKPIRFGCDVPAGWTASSLAGLWGPLAEAQKWIRTVAPESEGRTGPELPPAFVSGVVESTKPPAGIEPKGGVVFTGCRDKVLEGKLVALGYEVQDAITKKTTLLVIPDGPAKESTKLTKARSMGIAIRTLAEAKALAP